MCIRDRAIDSVLSQTYQDFELIVVDDGSTDGTRELVDSYIVQCPDRICYIYQSNQGLRSRNAGIERARGEYIAFLDSDDRWLPDRLAEGVKILDSRPNIGLVHTNIFWMEESGVIRGEAVRNKQFLSGWIFEDLFLRRADIACSTVLFRQECCRSVGMIDGNLSRLGSEDRDLWLRVAQKYEISYIDQSLVQYRLRSEGASSNKENMLQARLYIVEKYCRDSKYSNLKKAALAKIYRDEGDRYFAVGKLSFARKNYIRSIEIRPFSFWPWVNLLKVQFNLVAK